MGSPMALSQSVTLGYSLTPGYSQGLPFGERRQRQGYRVTGGLKRAGVESRDSFRFWFGVAFDGTGVRTSKSSGKLHISSKAEQSLFSTIVQFLTLLVIFSAAEKSLSAVGWVGI
jgi:hypothetical protein